MKNFTPMSAEALFALPATTPTLVSGAGDTACELFLPQNLRLTQGQTWPVVIAVHGVCWRVRHDMSHIRPFCTALSSLGYAVWSIEYRRVGNGGEWPVMFTDVGAAADRLREVADAQNLDLSRVAAIGHSAGGHLALWLASRHKKLVSEAHVGSPINLIGVVSLAGITDLADTLATNICTGNVINLMGGTPQQWPARYAAASPIELAPLGVPQYLIHGRHDDDVPLAHVQPYVARAQACGDNVTLAVIEDCGHFELVTPNSIAWPHIQRSLATLFQQTP